MFFPFTNFIFNLLAPCALFVGAAILVQKRFGKNIDSSSLCPFIALPIAIAALPVIYAYGMEAFIASYGANKFEADAFAIRYISGPYLLIYWAQIVGLLSSQLFWIPAIRRSPVGLMVIGLLLLLPARI